MSQYNFTPRLSDAGMMNNPLWYSNLNPYWASGWPLANCTTYCVGRTMEILRDAGYPNWDTETYSDLCGPMHDNAWTWYTSSLWTTGQEPALGCVMVYDTIDTSTGEVIGIPGHVAQVEEIVDQNTIVLSESHWQQTYFDTRTVTRADGWYTPGWNVRYKGCIYLPISVQPGGSYDLIILLASMLRKKKRKKGGLI